MPRRPQDSEVANQMAERLGDRLRALRKELRWTQQEVAGRIDLSTESYARIERGYSLPSFPTLARLADAFATTSGYLLGDPPGSLEADDGTDDTGGFALPMSEDKRAERRARTRKVKRRNPREPDEPSAEKNRRRRAAGVIIRRRRQAPEAHKTPPARPFGVRRVTRHTVIDEIHTTFDVLDKADLRAVLRLVQHLAQRQAEVFEALESAEQSGMRGDREAQDTSDGDG